MIYRLITVNSILLTLVLLNTCSIHAQEVVLRGSVHRYSIIPVNTDADYNYTWSVSGGTSSNFGNGSESDAIIWDGPPGLYTISTFATDKHYGCSGKIHQLQVKVIDFPIKWQGISTNVCSSWGNEYRDFSLVAEFPDTSEPWSFEYQVDDNSAIIVNVSGGTTKVINIAGFVNLSSTTAETHKIRITKIILPDGHQFTFNGMEQDAAAHKHTVTVNPLPPAGTIEYIRDLE